MDKIELKRKSTYQGYIDIGLFYLPERFEYVTWIINRSLNNATLGGHYFKNRAEAEKDFENRR